MVNVQYEKSKQPLLFFRNQVEQVGRSIRKGIGDAQASILIIQNFRSAHLYLLTIINNLVRKHVRSTGLSRTVYFLF